MSKYLEFPLVGGGAIVIETPDERKLGGSGFVRGKDDVEQADKAALSFDQSIEAIRQSADKLVGSLRNLGTPPDELEIFFNLKAVGELGTLVVGKTNSDANFNVTLKWRKDEPKDEAAA